MTPLVVCKKYEGASSLGCSHLAGKAERTTVSHQFNQTLTISSMSIFLSGSSHVSPFSFSCSGDRDLESKGSCQSSSHRTCLGPPRGSILRSFMCDLCDEILQGCIVTPNYVRVLQVGRFNSTFEAISSKASCNPSILPVRPMLHGNWRIRCRIHSWC